MKDWRNRKSTYIEGIVITACVICLILGIIFDIQVHFGIVIHYVENLEDYSLTLLQIQAAVSTLTLSIIALITGYASETYMGISLTKFYLFIRPKVLKQDRIVFCALLLLLANSIMHLWGHYNVVIFIFVATFFLIFITNLSWRDQIIRKKRRYFRNL